jgi:hypothetical protein
VALREGASEDRHPAFVCVSRYGDSVTRCGGAETVSGSFRDHFVTKKIEFASLRPRALTAIFLSG